MKFRKIGWPAFLLLSALLVATIHHFSVVSGAPKFVPVVSVPAFSNLFDQFKYSSQQGNLWLFTTESGTSNRHHHYLFNLDQRKIQGELLNGVALGFNSDQSKLFCEQLGPPLLHRIAALVARFTRGKIHFYETNDVDTLWMLDLRNNSAKRIARIRQPFFVIQEHWHSSPGYRYAWAFLFDYPGKTPGHLTFHTINLETGDVQDFKINGSPCDWWDDQQLVVKNDDGNFVLLDAPTGKMTVLFSSAAIQEFLDRNHLSDKPADVFAFAMRHGEQYDFFFSGRDGFLAKADTAGRRIELVLRRSLVINQFYNPGRVDPTMTYRVDTYPSYPPVTPYGGVYLHPLTNDLANDSVVELVPPGEELANSSPRFYRDKIIYLHSNELWQIETNGSNNVRLFPSAGK